MPSFNIDATVKIISIDPFDFVSEDTFFTSPPLPPDFSISYEYKQPNRKSEPENFPANRHERRALLAKQRKRKKT